MTGRTVYYDHNGNEIEPPKADAVKPTNADRIRVMTDEELAEFIWNGCDNIGTEACKQHPGCVGCWLDWLKQEVE